MKPVHIDLLSIKVLILRATKGKWKRHTFMAKKEGKLFCKVTLHPRGVFFHRLKSLDDVMKS